MEEPPPPIFIGHKSNRPTGLGINNNGELVFPYGKEDTDYNIDGNPSSGYVFNGATSVFWCRLRDLLPGEITNTFNTVVAADCFSATSLINQFDQFQDCYPEEIWRLDIQRKYIRTFTGESVDNSKPKHDVQYLRDMMQGKKKYQRRQWIRDQEIYFGTKNLMNTVVGDDNRITFRCFTPTGDDIVVPPDYTLKITPYSDMYLSVMFGNGGTQQVRAKAGVEYTIECPLSTMDDTQVTIYGANRIQALSDLSACYIAANNFSMATKLRKLVLGNTTEGYNNSRLISLTLGRNKLLEELDIRNCGNLTGSINLSQCNNLLKLYAEGTKLSGVTFATNGKVRVAHLPDTINTLTMRNLNNLTDFEAALNRLETLTLQGGTLDSYEVVSGSISTLQVLYLYDIDWLVADTTILNAMRDMFYSLVTGSVYISGQVRNQELVAYESKWPDLEVTYNASNLVTQYLATYVNDDDENTVLYTTWVDRGSVPPDPVALGLINAPQKASTPQYVFTYDGWDDITSVMLAPRTITAQYTETTQTYTVTWYSRPGVSLGSTTAGYGEEVVYTGDTPVNTSEEGVYIYNVFAGWDKSTGYITGNTDVYALWERAEIPTVGTDLSVMTPAQIFAVTSANQASKYFESKDHFDLTLGHDFDFSNVESEVLAENLYLDGETAVDTEIQLFGEHEQSFTLAIDFNFKATVTNSTLLSCFDEDGAEGFRLRYNGAPNIQWGDKNQSFGYGQFRDVLVLRHIAGDDKLYVYASNSTNSSSMFDLGTLRVELVRNRSTATNNHLVFGAIRFTGDGGYDDYATGIIHWAKIWYGDLGDANARMLSAWPHEKLRMEYCGAGRYRLAGNTSQRSNASFIANNLLSERFMQMNTTNTNAGGWDSSKMRTFMESRILPAMPIVFQSMIKRVKINASAGSQSREILISEDKIYLPCLKEVDNGQTDATYVSEGDAIDFFTANTQRGMTLNGSRMKFLGITVPDDAVFFTSNTDPTENSSNTVRLGDVWVKSNDSSNGYIYVSSDYLTTHTLPSGLTTITSSDGLWVRAYWYWLRSPNVSNSTNFWGVFNNGGVYYNYGAYIAGGVLVGFSI